MPRKAPDRSAILVVLLLVLHCTGPHDVDARFRGAVQRPIPTVEKNAGLAKAGAGVMQRSCCKKIAVRSSDDVSEVPVFFTKCFELFGMHKYASELAKHAQRHIMAFMQRKRQSWLLPVLVQGGKARRERKGACSPGG